MSDFNLPGGRLDDLTVKADEAIKLHDDLLVSQPDGARHDRDICPICVDKASQTENSPSRIPPGSAGPDVSETDQPNTEGGTPESMSDNANTMTQATHEALVTQAVTQATQSTTAELASVTADRDDLRGKLEAAQSEVETLKADNARLNGDLDKAQVDLRAMTDKASTLEADLTKERDDRAKADIASKRSEQVKNLKLFPDEYVAEKASSWAEIDEAAWTERIDEWSKARGETTTGTGTAGTGTADTASAMTGTTETLTSGGDTASETKPTPRRAALGLN